MRLYEPVSIGAHKVEVIGHTTRLEQSNRNSKKEIVFFLSLSLAKVSLSKFKSEMLRFVIGCWLMVEVSERDSSRERFRGSSSSV